MANRLTDSRKWDDDWFLELHSKYKLLWFYLLDKCNHAGIYKSSSKLEVCCLDESINWEEVESVFGKRVVKLKENKYFLPTFIEFQYGRLNIENRCHKSVINILENEGLYKGLIRGLQGCIRKNKDKDKDKDIDKDKKKVGQHVLLTEEEYGKIVAEYGTAITKDYIKQLNLYIEQSGKQYKSHYATILLWLRKEGVQKQKGML